MEKGKPCSSYGSCVTSRQGRGPRQAPVTSVCRRRAGFRYLCRDSAPGAARCRPHPRPVLRQGRGYCAWMEAREWWYRHTFPGLTEPLEAGERLQLVFHGLDTYRDDLAQRPAAGQARQHVSRGGPSTSAVRCVSAPATRWRSASIVRSSMRTGSTLAPGVATRIGWPCAKRSSDMAGIGLPACRPSASGGRSNYAASAGRRSPVCNSLRSPSIVRGNRLSCRSAWR